MSAIAQGKQPFLLLSERISKGFRERLVRDVLERRAGLSLPHRSFFDEVLRKVRVSGFRSLQQAPQPLQARILASVIVRSNHVAGTVLSAWAELNNELQGSCREFLESRGIPSVGPEELPIGLSETWSWDGAIELAEAFHETHPDSAKTDVALMVSWLTGTPAGIDEGREDMLDEREAGIAGETEEADRESEVHAMRWDNWLEELRSLPAEAPEWDAIDDFLVAIKDIAEKKRNERSVARDGLREALADLVGECEGDLAFFGVAECSAWNQETCPLADVPALTERVRELRASLRRYADLLRHQAPTLSEERTRRVQLDALEQQIQQMAGGLAQTLTGAPSISEAPGPQGTLPGAVEHPAIAEPTDRREIAPEPVTEISRQELDRVPDDNAAVRHEGPGPSTVELTTSPPGHEVSGLEVEGPPLPPAPGERNTPGPVEVPISAGASTSPLLTSREAARALQDEQTDDRWSGLLWALAPNGRSSE